MILSFTPPPHEDFGKAWNEPYMQQYAYLVRNSSEPCVDVFRVMPGGLLVRLDRVTATDLQKAVTIATEIIEDHKEDDVARAAKKLSPEL